MTADTHSQVNFRNPLPGRTPTHRDPAAQLLTQIRDLAERLEPEELGRRIAAAFGACGLDPEAIGWRLAEDPEADEALS